MKMMFRLKLLSKSLFIRLLVSFALIILLLSSFNFLSFSFFRDQVQEEILTYNNFNLQQTVDSYETHLKLLNNLVLGFYINDRVRIVDKDLSTYEAATIRADIRSTVANQELYMENLVLFFRSSGLVLEKEGSSTADKMFSKYYVSDKYNFDFWQKQFNQSYAFRMFPIAEFKENSFTESTKSKGRLLPVVIKHKLFPNLFMLAFLDGDRTFQAFHRSINTNFIILDSQGQLLYSSGTENFGPLPELVEGQHYVQSGDFYYFYNKGAFSGHTYVNIIPNRELNSKVSKLNYTLISLLMISIIIGIGASILFSMKINNPVQKIIQSIKQFNETDSSGEFEQIGSAIDQLFKTNKDIKQVLDDQNSLLTYYAYTNRVKNIHHSFDDFKMLHTEDRTFRLVLFQLFFTNRFDSESEVGKARATYFLREFTRQYISSTFQNSHTFQVENDQILTIIFPEQGEPEPLQMLHGFRELLEHDKEMVFMTIALSPEYDHAADFTTAYENVLDRASSRLLNADIQFIAESTQTRDEPLILTLTQTQEQEFDANLRNGNESVVVPLVSRILTGLQKKEASATEFRAFAQDLAERTIKTLVQLGVDYRSGGLAMPEITRRIQSCYTLEQLESILEQTLSTACHLIQTRKDQRDPMTSFVLDYLESHYHEDITLDLVAEKLDISGGYLSTYFKEKTGKNFIDYVHEVRINKAKELLLRSDMLIQEAASQVGYNNLNSFNRMFKKYTGSTPSEFRKNSV